MAERVFGDVGVAVGTSFVDRKALAAAGVHRPPMAGISGAAAEGADSIVVSGGYEDDVDEGDVIVYTGHGGNDIQTGQQVADQFFVRGNLALTVNQRTGLSVRVVRGAHQGNPYAPASGYRYDGLFRVENCWRERGRSGFFVCRFRLRALALAALPPRALVPAASPASPAPGGRATPARVPTTVQRIVRSTRVAEWVKQKYDYECQVCGVRLVSPTGPYAEGAHIQALGAPHNGPDVPENVLCLCPNHHTLFDLGAFTIRDTLEFTGIAGRLRIVQGHAPGVEFIAYHRVRYETMGAKPTTAAVGED